MPMVRTTVRWCLNFGGLAPAGTACTGAAISSCHALLCGAQQHYISKCNLLLEPYFPKSNLLLEPHFPKCNQICQDDDLSMDDLDDLAFLLEDMAQEDAGSIPLIRADTATPTSLTAKHAGMRMRSASNAVRPAASTKFRERASSDLTSMRRTVRVSLCAWLTAMRHQALHPLASFALLPIRTPSMGGCSTEAMASVVVHCGYLLSLHHCPLAAEPPVSKPLVLFVED